MWKRSALFRFVTQHVVVSPYRRFGTTHRVHFQGSRCSNIFFFRFLWTSWRSKIGPIGYTETSVGNASKFSFFVRRVTYPHGVRGDQSSECLDTERDRLRGQKDCVGVEYALRDLSRKFFPWSVSLGSNGGGRRWHSDGKRRKLELQQKSETFRED